MISVILPAYNTPEKYLREAIESVLAQTYRDWELLVIDDSTTIPVDGIVKSYSDPRIRYFRNEKNIGMANSRNRGLEIAQGEFIALLDHDDVWLPEKLEKQLKIMEEDMCIGLVYSPITFWGKKTPHEQQTLYPDTVRSLILTPPILTCSAVLLRRHFLRKNFLFFEQSVAPCDDYDLWLRLALFSKIKRSKESYVLYRVHEGNISSNVRWMRSKLPFLYQRFLRFLWQSDIHLYKKFIFTIYTFRSMIWAYRYKG